jgi:hypothetical protein
MHSKERVADMEAKMTDEYLILIEKANEHVKYCQSDYQLLENSLNELQEQLENVREHINETCKSYKSLVDKKCDEILKELDIKHKNKELLVMDYHNTVDASIARLEEFTAFARRALRNANVCEMLMLRGKMHAQLRHLLGSAPQCDQIDTELKFSTDEKTFQKALDEAFGRFYTPKELKQSYLNNLANSSSSMMLNTNLNNLNSTNSANSDHQSITMHQQQQQQLSKLNEQKINEQRIQLQKQLDQLQLLQQQQRRSPTQQTPQTSALEQEWISNILINIGKLQRLLLLQNQHYIQQQQQNGIVASHTELEQNLQQLQQLQARLQQHQQYSKGISNEEWPTSSNSQTNGIISSASPRAPQSIANQWAAIGGGAGPQPLTARINSNNNLNNYFGLQSGQQQQLQMLRSNSPLDMFNCPTSSKYTYRKSF